MAFAQMIARSGRLLIAVPFFGLATGALFPVVALQLEAEGSDPAFIGLVTTVYYCGAFLAAVLFGALLARIGHRAGFAVSALLAAGATYALTLTQDATAWLLLRFVGGFALGAYYVVVDGWFQALADRRTRGKVFATYETIRLAATAAGPFLLVLGAVQASLLVVAGAYLLSILPAWLNPEPDHVVQKTYRFGGLLSVARCFPFAITLAACGGIANASFYGLSALYAVEIGLPLEGVAFFVAFVLVAPAISEIPLGALADHFGRMKVALACALAALTACLGLVAIATPPLWLACLGGAVVGGAMVPMYAFGLSRINDAQEGQGSVEATSAGLIAYNAGAFAGPVLAGTAFAMLGPEGLYVFLACIACLAVIAALSDITLTRCCPEGALG